MLQALLPCLDGVEFEVKKIPGEVILTLGSSRTVLEFLCAAKEKKRSFRVFVAEGAPRYQGHLLANDLVTRGLQTTLITDSAVFAMISRVNMVIVGAHAVMANGGVTAPVGMFLWLNSLQLCQNRQPHPINQAAYKFYLGVRGIFCEQRTMEKPLHFLQVLKDIF